ncbi:unnamed protein product, partial [Vitis vinifera]
MWLIPAGGLRGIGLKEVKRLTSMSTAIEGLGQEKLHFRVLTSPVQDDQIAWYYAISFVARLVAYVSTLGLLVIFIFLILKYFGDFGSETTTFEEEVRETETNPLLPSKRVPFTYGACEEDLESGEGNGGSSQDLYDGKICVICFDEPRNCFFVPCGHCATCYVCAQRIAKGDNSVCPVCRRFIRKVRKFIVQ